MKKIFVMLLAAVAMASCEVREDDSKLLKDNGLLSVNIGGWESDVTPTRASASDAGVSYISFKVFSGTTNSIGDGSWGDAVYSIIQDTVTTPSTNFGHVSCELDAGTYTIVATANKGENTGSVDIASPAKATVPQSLMQQTWSKVSEVTVVADQKSELSMTLPMVSAQLQIKNTGAKDSNASYVKITVGDATGSSFSKVIFNPNTGYALSGSEGGADKYVNISSTLPEKDGICSIDIPLWKTSANTDAADTAKVYLPVLIKVYNSTNDVLYQYDVSSVPFKLSFTTILEGDLYSNESSGTLTFTALQSEEDLKAGF